MKNKTLPLIIIPCWGIAVYINTFHCSFQFDDRVFIIDNIAIRNIANLQSLWNYYPCRFITFVSLALNYHFGQLNVFGYHLFNLAIHLSAALLVWWLVHLTLSCPVMKNNKITKHAEMIALFSGLVFVSHPLQTEAVTYIWQRSTSMAAMFYLASLCLYVKSRLLRHSQREGSETIFYAGSLLAAISAMFTKENAITLPLVILLYENFFLFKKGVRGSLKCPQAAIPFLCTLLIIPLTMIFNTGTAPKEAVNIPPFDYLMTQFRVMLTYIRLLIVPINQNLDYDYPIVKNIFEPPVLLSISCLGLIVWSAKRLFANYRLISFSICWFFLTLLPESSLLPLQDVIFEHRLYLPMAGYSIFLVSGLYYLLEKHTFKSTACVLLVIITWYSCLTFQRNSVWKNEMTMLNDVIQKSPHKERPLNNRGLIFSTQGKLPQAIADFTKAIEINPTYTNAYINRGFMYNKQGDFNLAILDYSRAIEINPRLPEALIDRGNVFLKLGNTQQALSDFQNAVTLTPDNPYFADTYFDLGYIYYKQGNFIQAVSNYSKVIRINPNDTQAYNNRAVAYFQLKDYDRSWNDVEIAEKSGGEVNPQLIDALKQVTGKER